MISSACCNDPRSSSGFRQTSKRSFNSDETAVVTRIAVRAPLLTTDDDDDERRTIQDGRRGERTCVRRGRERGTGGRAAVSDEPPPRSGDDGASAGGVAATPASKRGRSTGPIYATLHPGENPTAAATAARSLALEPRAVAGAARWRDNDGDERRRRKRGDGGARRPRPWTRGDGRPVGAPSSRALSSPSPPVA